MLVSEALFILFPTIIGITISFFVGVAVGVTIILLAMIGFYYLLFSIPGVKSSIQTYLED